MVTYIYIFNPHVIQICPGITSGRVLDGELLYTKILEVNLFAFAYRLFHEDFSPINQFGSTGHSRWLERNLYETFCRQMQTI